MNNNILDDLEKIKNLDKQDMLGVEENFMSQLVEAKKIAESADYKNLASLKFKGLAVLGMGGSGFSGDIIKSLTADRTQIPVEVVKGYEMPVYIAKGWLAVAVSYSGDTEETIACVKQALQRGCEIVFVSSGGKLKEIAAANDKCHLQVPAGFQPRGASGYLFFSTYLMLSSIGIFKVSEAEIDETMEIIKRDAALYNRMQSTQSNPAKKLALELKDKMPVIYGVNGFLSAVAYRWKCEINENAKCPAFFSEFPELNHNETVGWQNIRDISREFILVIFRDPDASARIKTRIDTTVKIISNNLGGVIEINVRGRSSLAKAVSTMYLGDMASVYLALLYCVDPTPVERISVLKAELAKLD